MNASTIPAVSVLMSVHNGEKYLADAVDSILGQTFRDFEFIIIDDGSTDRSRSILEAYAARDARIRLSSHGQRGLTKCLNEGLALVRGKFVARMDADDVSLPERFDRQVRFLKENEDCVAVGSGVMMTDSELRPIQLREQPVDNATICKELLRGKGGVMTHPVIMMRSSALRVIGNYDERFSTSQDLDLFIRLSEVGRLENLSAVLLLYRQHSQSINHNKQSTWHLMRRMAVQNAIARQGADAFVEKLFPPEQMHVFAPDNISWARAAFGGEQDRSAWRYVLKALLTEPGKLQAIELICSLAQRKSFSAVRNVLRQFRRTRPPQANPAETEDMDLRPVEKLR